MAGDSKFMNIRDTPMLQIRFKKGKVVKKIGRGEIQLLATLDWIVYFLFVLFSTK